MFNMFHIVPLMDMCCLSGFSACLIQVATTLVTIPMVKKMSSMTSGFSKLSRIGSLKHLKDLLARSCKITNPCHGAETYFSAMNGFSNGDTQFLRIICDGFFLALTAEIETLTWKTRRQTGPKEPDPTQSSPARWLMQLSQETFLAFSCLSRMQHAKWKNT